MPIEVNELGSVTEVNAVQPLKELSPIEVSEVGRVTDVNI